MRRNNTTYDSSPKRIHKLLGDPLPPKSSLHSVRDPNGVLHVNPEEVKSVVHTHFQTELSSTFEADVPPWMLPGCDDPFELPKYDFPKEWPETPLSLDRLLVTEALHRLPVAKAPGPDGIPNEILKFLPDATIDTIWHVFKAMLASGLVPRTWCHSTTFLLWKGKKSPDFCEAYRPIAPMNTLLKLWTSILKTIGSEWVEHNGLLGDTQDGFRRMRRIFHSHSSLISAMEHAIIHSRNIYICYIDFRGAFNNMEHSALFDIMIRLGFPPHYVRLCRNLYSHATTSIKTPHGNFGPIPIQKGTL